MVDSFLLKKLEELRTYSKKQSISRLKMAGDEISSESLVRDDKNLVNVAIVFYSLSKLLQKHYILSTPAWKLFYSDFRRATEEAEKALKDGEMEGFYELFSDLVKEIGNLSMEQGRFQSSLVEKAKIKTATQIYAHGASLRTASEFVGGEARELASYIGVTKLPDKYGTMSVKERLKLADRIFSS